MSREMNYFAMRGIDTVRVIERPIPIQTAVEAITEMPNLNRYCEQRVCPFRHLIYGNGC
ncbi:MAG: hypothetical protein ACI9G1_002706 [Pirellulaceae bacterium]|jgi:hypothetical protein